MIVQGRQIQAGMYRRIVTSLLLCICLSMLAACQADMSIAEDRDQAQAVRIVSLLNGQGVAAYATKNRTGGRFSVTVPGRFYHQSIALINRYELAGETEPTIQELVQSRGILPGSRDAEKFKLDLALAMQLEDSLENLQGVMSAQVIVRKHMVKDPKDAGCSVTLLLKPDARVAQDLVLNLVRASLPEINRRNVVIERSTYVAVNADAEVLGAGRNGDTVFTVPLTKFLYWQVPEGDHGGLVVSFLTAIGITALVFIGIGYVIGYIRSIRSIVPQEGAPTESDMIGFSVERSNKNLPEV